MSMWRCSTSWQATSAGASAFVKPGENLEEPVSAFYAKISRPVLTDISLDFGAVKTSDLYPAPLPDLFVGSQLVVVGRYRSSGATTITLKGMVNNQSQQFAYGDLSFAQQTGSDTAFVARLWATRRIGYLVTQINLHGSNKELVDEIVSLGLRYGIVTPYTSFLVDERQDVLAPRRPAEGRRKPGPQSGLTCPGSSANSGGCQPGPDQAARGDERGGAIGRAERTGCARSMTRRSCCATACGWIRNTSRA